MTSINALLYRMTGLASDALAWLTRNLTDIVLASVAAAAFVALLLGLRALGLRLCRTQGIGILGSLTGQILSSTRVWFIVAAAIELVARIGEAPPTIAAASRLLFTAAAAFQVAIWIRRMVVGWVAHRAADDGDPRGSFASAVGIIQLLASFTAFTVATLFVLDNVGINVTTLLAGLGIGGIAIGLAAQGIFKDLFAALSILFDRPFRRGDQIEYGALGGRVETIGLKSTKLRSLGGERLIVSNARLLDQDIRNISEIQSQRVTLKLNLLYRNDPGLFAGVPEALEEAVNGVDKARFGHGLIVNFGDAAIEVELMFFVQARDRDTMRRVRHNVAVAVLQRFDALDIEFHFPAPPPPKARRTAEEDRPSAPSFAKTHENA